MRHLVAGRLSTQVVHRQHFRPRVLRKDLTFKNSIRREAYISQLDTTKTSQQRIPPFTPSSSLQATYDTMPRPRGELHKVFLQREGNDFVALVDDIAEYRKWKEGDTSIPLANFAQFKVYDTHKQGAQGILDEASRATLHSSFGTENEENCLKSILHDGSVQTTQSHERVADNKKHELN